MKKLMNINVVENNYENDYNEDIMFRLGIN